MMDVINSNAFMKEILEKLQDIDFDIDEFEVSNDTESNKKNKKNIN